MSENGSDPTGILTWFSRILLITALGLSGIALYFYFFSNETPSQFSTYRSESYKQRIPKKEDLERWLTKGEQRHVHAESSGAGESLGDQARLNDSVETRTLNWNQFSKSETRGLKAVGVQKTVPSPGKIDFQLPLASGGTLDLSDYRGKWILLNFWASWCAPCRNEMPALQELAKRLPENRFRLLGVNVGESPEQVSIAMDELKVDFPVVVDQETKITDQYRVRYLPTSWIIDPAGNPIGRIRGAIEWTDPPVPKLFQQIVSKKMKRMSG